jgi:hypothetical protein
MATDSSRDPLRSEAAPLLAFFFRFVVRGPFHAQNMERIEIGSRNSDNPKIGQQQTILKTMERLGESDCRCRN